MKFIQQMWRGYVYGFERDPMVRWLSTGGNVFYPFALLLAIGATAAVVEGQILPSAVMLPLAFICLLYAGFSEPRR